MRPQFHFTATGWINDPHGVTFSHGRYHLFFQHVPDSTTWRVACSWGHAAGEDLVSFLPLPPALAPGEGDDGIWSGSLAVSPDGSPRIFYTSVSADRPAVGRVRTASSTDPELVSWTKGPVVAEAPAGAGIHLFRDPVVTPTADGWSMVVGAGLEGGVAAALGYSSPDGVEWTGDGVVVARDSALREPVWAGSMWECPQLVEVDGVPALIVSVWHEETLHDVLYALGELREGRFVPSTWGRLSHGSGPYAATTFRDRDGRTCVMFWIRGVAGDGWTGAHSIPYVLSSDGVTLELAPHPDLDAYHSPPTPLDTALDVLWPEHGGATLDIHRHGRALLGIERGTDALRVRVDDGDHLVPWSGDLRVVLDGPVLEISSRAGVFASAMPPLEEGWQLIGSGLSVRALRREGGPRALRREDGPRAGSGD